MKLQSSTRSKPLIDRKNRIKELYTEGYTEEQAVEIIEKKYPPGTLSTRGKPISRHKSDVHLTYYELAQFNFPRKDHGPQFWWANQNQTHKHEIKGGYMCSPKAKKNGANNIFYENMTKVKLGGVVFSFIGPNIQYLGVITSNKYRTVRTTLESHNGPFPIQRGHGNRLDRSILGL